MRFLPLIGLLWSGVALAQTPADTQPLEPLSSPYLLKLTGGLILVVLLIFVFAHLIKRLNLNPQTNNGVLKIVAGMSLGTRDRILLLQVGEEQILLGLSPGRIEKLHTLAEPLQTEDAQPVSSSFADKLNRLLRDREAS